MDWTLPGTLRLHADARPSRPMLTTSDRTFTWSEMAARARRVAGGLSAEGIGAQDRIAFLDKNGPAYFDTLLGGGLVNAVSVAVNWRLAPAEMEYIVNDAEARVLFVGPEFLPHLEAMEGRLSTVKKIVVIGSHERHESYDAWLGRQPETDPGLLPGVDDVAMQLYTSGTTGLPKGVMLTNAEPGRPPAARGRAVGARCDLGQHGCDAAVPHRRLGLGARRPVAWRARPCWSASSCRRRWWHSLERRRVTNALFVPAMLHFLTLRARRGRARLRRAADASPTALRRSPPRCWCASMRTFRCRFVQLYGLTETTGAITAARPRRSRPGRARAARLLRSCGRPYPWVELRIVDPDSGSRPAQPARSASYGRGRSRT